VILFVDEPRNYLGSSSFATLWKDERHDWDRQMMVTIVWNQQDFHFIEALPKGQKFNASYQTDMIL
jgi:hypothetical protein